MTFLTFSVYFAGTGTAWVGMEAVDGGSCSLEKRFPCCRFCAGEAIQYSTFSIFIQ